MATENVLTDEVAPESESTRTAAAGEVLRLMVKAQKAQRLYDGKNAVSERLQRDVYDRLSQFLESAGDLHLAVEEFRLKSDDDVVYDSQDRNDSLAFLLYRDGIRRLSFHGGLEPDELDGFFKCLNRVALLANDRDDLVTLFWEQDFRSIRYFAIEELSSAESLPRLQDQLSTGELACDGDGAGAPGVSLDLDQPVSTVPVEACRLDDAEIEALRAEIANEGAVPFQHLVVELAIELTLLEEDENERLELARSLIAIGDRLIADGALEELAAMEEHLDGLHGMVFADEERVRHLAASFREHLAHRDRVSAFLAKVDEHHVPKPEVLTTYLARIRPSHLESLLAWMGRLSSSAYRRAVTNALLVSEGGGIDVIVASLPLGPPGPSSREQLEHRQLVRELLYALSHHPGERALPVLERFLAAADPETRRESFVALTRYPEAIVETLSVERLLDRDPEIRTTALDTLVRRGRAEIGERILARSLQPGALDFMSLNEKRRLFAAVAKLSGEAALEPLGRELWDKEDRWFASKKDKELVEAVAHGVRMIGTDKAHVLLARCAENGVRFVKAACARELGR